MPKYLKITLFMLFSSLNLLAQTNYNGFIDKYPIEFLADFSSPDNITGVYTYKKFDEPIPIKGKIEGGNLIFYEKDENGSNRATLTFAKFNAKSDILTGFWNDSRTNKKLEITLNKDFEISYKENAELKSKEIIQKSSLKNHYFKLVLSKSKGDFSVNVVAVKILEKKTDKLIQKFDIACQLLNFDNISIDDYNFDGLEDFAVFQANYAGANTSSLYFLYDKESQKYFESGFAGVSLEFDKKTKTVFEQNQCCAGTSRTTALYKIVRNKMILIEQHCYKWDEKKKDMIERPLKDCQ